MSVGANSWMRFSSPAGSVIPPNKPAAADANGRAAEPQDRWPA